MIKARTDLFHQILIRGWDLFFPIILVFPISWYKQPSFQCKGFVESLSIMLILPLVYIFLTMSAWLKAVNSPRWLELERKCHSK